MQLIKCIILSIISSITNTLPISYSQHITIFQNLFNTNIFDNQNLITLLNISLVISIIIFLSKEIFIYLKTSHYLKKVIKDEKNKIKKNKTKLPTENLIKHKKSYKKHTKILKIIILANIISSIIYNLTSFKITNIKLIALSYILTSIILLLCTNKKDTKSFQDLTYKHSLILGLSTLLCFIPTISPLCAFLFTSKIIHLNKKTSLNISLLNIIFILILNSIPSLIYLLNNQIYLINYLISIIISTYFSLHILKTFKKIYSENKLYKLSIYCLFLSIFILIWFR